MRTEIETFVAAVNTLAGHNFHVIFQEPYDVQDGLVERVTLDEDENGRYRIYYYGKSNKKVRHFHAWEDDKINVLEREEEYLLQYMIKNYGQRP